MCFQAFWSISLHRVLCLGLCWKLEKLQSSPPSQKILIAPLDWGLGHATRCIPVVREFLDRGCEVQIASSGAALVLLKQEFPPLKFHELVSYKATYSDQMAFMLKILLQMPKFLWAIQREH